MGEENKLDDLGASIAEIERLLGMRDAADANPVKENKKYGQTYVRVSKDLHEAWLYLARPKEGEYYTKEEILGILEQNGVRAGLIMSNIIAMVKKRCLRKKHQSCHVQRLRPGAERILRICNRHNRNQQKKSQNQGGRFR